MRVDMDVQCHQSPARIHGLRHERLASPAELPCLIEPAQVGDAGIIGDAFAQRMLCKGGHQLVARGAARCCVLVAVEAEAADLADGWTARHLARAQMGIMLTEKMRALGREQPRRCAVTRSEEHTSELQSLMR